MKEIGKITICNFKDKYYFLEFLNFNSVNNKAELIEYSLVINKNIHKKE